MTLEQTIGMNLELKERAEGGGTDQMSQKKFRLVVVEHHRLTLAVLVDTTAGSHVAAV